MAKVISLFELSGSVGDATFCKNDFGVHMKMKGGPTAWQVKNLDRFARTRHNAAEWKRITAASKLARNAISSLLPSVKNMGLSSRMNGQFFSILRSDQLHDWGERVVSSGDLSTLTDFEFNGKLSLDDALPVNPAHCYSIAAGKVVVNIPAFRLRKKKGLPETATHYRMVSGVVWIDFEKKKYRLDKEVGELQAMGRAAGTAFNVEQVIPAATEQGCFWLLGIEFYTMVNEQPKLVKGGALRIMEWIGKTSPAEYAGVAPEVVEEGLPEKSLHTDTLSAMVEELDTVASVEMDVKTVDTTALVLEAFWEAVDAGGEFERSVRVLLPVKKCLTCSLPVATKT
ncbi:hypothetical protein D3H65_12895 [Paraflavitalea soli]|uniref:Uncharacterized protein n=1 Tax=Paraflavitalea soli TaxID=2315862 RepID=A0A3B7MT58_9BACT|nr:hypothetical protein [Paraflavitalea soli]AXY74825.1 hypothetical protein D3H65_12895 [Paraflavitalea soli]